MSGYLGVALIVSAVLLFWRAARQGDDPDLTNIPRVAIALVLLGLGLGTLLIHFAWH